MLNSRRVLRLLTSEIRRSMFRESAPSSPIGQIHRIPLFRQDLLSQQRLNVHTGNAAARANVESVLSAESQPAVTKKPLGKLEGKIRLSFTCKRCTTRSTKIITRLGYEKGVVIVRCDGCKNNHLIADNLGWFTDLNGQNNIEKILKTKGEHVRKIRCNEEGYIEAIQHEDYRMIVQKKKLENESAAKSEQIPSDAELSSKS